MSDDETARAATIAISPKTTETRREPGERTGRPPRDDSTTGRPNSRKAGSAPTP
jgi:hypothetical protein